MGVFDGWSVGSRVGAVGVSVVGTSVGRTVGLQEGILVPTEGRSDGANEGAVGLKLGGGVGVDGCEEGCPVGMEGLDDGWPEIIMV